MGMMDFSGIPMMKGNYQERSKLFRENRSPPNAFNGRDNHRYVFPENNPI